MSRSVSVIVGSYAETCEVRLDASEECDLALVYPLRFAVGAKVEFERLNLLPNLEGQHSRRYEKKPRGFILTVIFELINFVLVIPMSRISEIAAGLQPV